MIHVTLVKPNVMQKLVGMNIIIQIKVQNHQNTFDVTSTTVLYGLSFLMLQKNAKTRKNLETSYIALWNLILPNKRTLKDWFHLEMVSRRAINDIMQTTKKEVHFFFFLICSIVFNCSWQLIRLDKKQKSLCKTYSFSNWWWLIRPKSFV